MRLCDENDSMEFFSTCDDFRLSNENEQGEYFFIFQRLTRYGEFREKYGLGRPCGLVFTLQREVIINDSRYVIFKCSSLLSNANGLEIGFAKKAIKKLLNMLIKNYPNDFPITKMKKIQGVDYVEVSK